MLVREGVVLKYGNFAWGLNPPPPFYFGNRKFLELPELARTLIGKCGKVTKWRSRSPLTLVLTNFCSC